MGIAGLVTAYRLRSRRGQASPTEVAPLPANAQQAAAGYSFTRSEGGHEVFTVHAQRSTDLKNGQGTVLDGVLVEVPGRSGDRHDLIEANRCESSGSGNFSCSGPVKMELDALRSIQTISPAPDSAAPATLHGKHPIYVNTSNLVYNQQTGLLTGTAHVDWRYGSAAGSAVGLAYDTRGGSIELGSEVQASLPVQALRDSRGASLPSVVQLTAAHLRYAKDQRQITLSGPVQATEGGRQVEAGHAVLDLDKQSRLSRALLDSGVQALEKSEAGSRTVRAAALEASFDPASGDLTDLTATGTVHLESQAKSGAGVSRLDAGRAHVSFTGAHVHPTNGEASGDVHLSSEPDSARRGAQVAGTKSGPGSRKLARQELEAADLEFTFRPADATLDNAQTIGPGKLSLISADPRSGNRIITAGQFQMTFDLQSRLQDLRGLGPTQILFEPAPEAPRGSVAMESRGDHLQASIDPVSGAVQSMAQTGHFRFIDADRRAAADRADYSEEGDVLTLNGSPVVSDPNTRLRADHAVVHLATNTVEGWGHVSTTRAGDLADEGQARGAQDLAASPTTGGAGNDVTNVLADGVTADRSQQVFRYLGHVRAWRGAEVIEAPELDLYRVERRIVADSGVVTSDLQPSPPKNSPQSGPASVESTAGVSAGPDAHISSRTRGINPPSPLSTGKPGATQPVTIRADHLDYRDLEHKALYRGHVRMDSSGATLECGRLDAYFTAPEPGQPSQLDRAVAEDHVILTEPGRRGVGNHADYFAREGKLVMTGGPPSLYDAQKGFTTGRSLTFFTQDDSLIVDGGSGFRSRSEHRLSQ
ncbi:MAG TPA: LptA/OstA family protein [Steroidobacteraceae bacterium]|nr:LptA/OstA family protein [Steroidobacteraceae bacterium]